MTKAAPMSDDLREALEGLVNFAWSAVRTDTDAAAIYLNSLLENARQALATPASSTPVITEERKAIVAYLRHMVELRQPGAKAAHEISVLAADIEAGFHLDSKLNPAALATPPRAAK